MGEETKWSSQKWREADYLDFDRESSIGANTSNRSKLLRDGAKKIFSVQFLCLDFSLLRRLKSKFSQIQNNPK